MWTQPATPDSLRLAQQAPSIPAKAMMFSSESQNDSLSHNDAGVDRSTAHVGLVCTHAMELKSFLKRLDRRRKYTDRGMRFTGGFLGESIRVAVVEAGSGFAAHRQAAAVLVIEHEPAWVISAGFSSSLTNDLPPGELSLAMSVCDTHGQKMDVNCPVPASPHAGLHAHVVADTHPSTRQQKSELAAGWKAAAVDTTSLAVAQICDSAKRRFLSIRAILDAADENIPESAVELIMTPKTLPARITPARLLARFRKPPEFREWEDRATTLSLRLSRFLVGVVEQIGEHVQKRQR